MTFNGKYRGFLIVCFIFLAFGVQAQENHFIYIQTEDSQPFYVRLNGKVFSSTAGGYVILPKLASGNYQLAIGFPKNQFPERNFEVAIGGANEGYLLKKLEKGWSLFNIETLALIEGTATQPPQKTETASVSNDPFTSLLADVVQDSSILKNNTPVTKPVEEKNIVVRTDSTKAAGNETAVNSVENPVSPAMPDSSNAGEPLKPKPTGQGSITNAPVSAAGGGAAENPMKRILLVNEVGGLELVYVDKSLNDTIRMFMPVTRLKTPEKTAKVIYTQPKTEDTSLTITPTIIETTPSKKESKSTEEKQVVESGKKVQNTRRDGQADQKEDQIIYEPENSDTLKEKKNDENPGAKVIYSSGLNPDCKNFATDTDFMKLRRKMAAQSGDDKMIDVAKRYFQSKCYSTDQIGNLSFLFLDEEGKYKFFDAAYPFTADTYNFYKLQSKLKDPYYINRFKAMIHK